ncbi:MAG TPA: nuclear transport factor 2 family protein [Chitinophagaceae bacterium]|jgi:ketosteroid isomerase-like protein|nr:nuclear transport factor 2 family protein [Chitinophagaceae bacterium]
MTTQEIAHRLVQFSRRSQFEQAQRELYTEDAVSIESNSKLGFPKETHGLNQIIEKGDRFESMVEQFHECTVSEPLVTENSIAFVLTMDLTMKGQGRSKMEEICVYQVKDGKITSEHFFY